MLSRPYDLSVSAEEFDLADKWWRSLSINEMKEFEKLYFPFFSCITHRMIHQMWEEQGKPQPLV